MRKIICVILALFLASSAAFAGYQIFREYTERQESADTYTDLENLISFPEDLPEEEPDETNLPESGETEPTPVGPTIDFVGLKEINEDCVAWIYIEDIQQKASGRISWKVDEHIRCCLGGRSWNLLL